MYYDPLGYGPLNGTLADAKQSDPHIRLDDVKQLFDESVEQKKQLHGTNIFVANGTKYKYQLDLFVIAHLKNQEYEAMMICTGICF